MTSKLLNNKKAMAILLLAVLGLMIGVGTFFGLSALHKPSDLPAYIGEAQLALLQADSQLAMEHLFIKEAATFAASSAVFALGQRGGFYEIPSCGDVNGVPVWARAKENKYCLPEPTVPAAFEKHFNDAMMASVAPLKKNPPSYALRVEQKINKARLVGSARTDWGALVTIKEKRGAFAELAKNMSFTAELPYDFTDYTVLGSEIKTLVSGVAACRQQKSLPACVEEWLDTVNTGPFLTQKRITLHYDGCGLPADAELEKLRSATGTASVFCALNENGQTFLAYDVAKGTIEERPVEYWFSIDFG